MSGRQVQILIAVLFLVVGVVSASNTYRLHAYIRATVPRDVAQEQCNTATIDALKSWLLFRSTRDAAMDRRDEASIDANNALVGVLDSVVAGEKPSAEELQAWRDKLRAWNEAVAADRAIRAQSGEQRVPLPQC